MVEKLEVGDQVVLSAGSMRMAVESVEGENVSVVWCHEGRIGRDVFSEKLLRKWEHRESSDRGGRDGGSKPHRGDRDGGGRPYRGGGDRDERPPRGKPGWDGKPREKKYFRKD